MMSCDDVIILQDLEAAVKKAVTGDLAALLLSLLMPPQEHDAHRLQQAMAVSIHAEHTCSDSSIHILCVYPNTCVCRV